MRAAVLALALPLLIPAQQFSLSLVTPPGQIRPGTTLQVTVSLSGTNGTNLAAWEAVMKSSISGTWHAGAGPAAAIAAKQLYCNTVAYGFKCLEAGINQNVFTDGVVAIYLFDIPQNATPGGATLTFSGTMGASLAGAAISLTGTSLDFTLKGRM